MQDASRYGYWQTVGADAIRYGGGSGLGAVLKLLAGNRMFRVTFTLRSCQAARGLPAPLRAPLLAACRLAHRWTQHSAAMDLPWETEVGPGLRILHGWGLVVNANARIGANVTLFHGVTLGQKDDLLPSGRVTHYPELGDGVWVGPHAVVIGVSVGDECIVAASSVVTKPVPRRTVVAGNPGKPVAEVAVPDIPNPAPVAGRPGVSAAAVAPMPG
ncbi:serine acetyltransferase [Azospirillum picis]|uniref:Serine O-acetyltransferase n=1 Tax=Azospirillum picis TaxID=488438 RepID=A0ABU0MGV2_9PROT|nr:serine acetyltransferase [Azospirillum picis]MBP2299106.1 serine O-acetyltransferase [Azospirillum picis]MDQ0532652.1 serine O-acetyltransferase [Azospirillum picis]